MKDIEKMAVKAITDILARSDKSFEASMQSVALQTFRRVREQGRQERDRQWEIRLGEFRKDLERHNLHGHYNLFQEHFAEPMAERYVAGAAYRELMAAAQAHVTALEACEPAISNAFGFSAIHGGNYTGPTYGKELTALKAALAALPAQDAERDHKRIAELQSQLNEAKAGWDSAIADLYAAAEIAKGMQSRLDAKWISVDERLPEATQGQVEGPFIISDDVLCYWPADGGIHEVCNYDHEDHRWRLVHKAFEEPDCEPTHWQPLPPPPSGAKGETKP